MSTTISEKLDRLYALNLERDSITEIVRTEIEKLNAEILELTKTIDPVIAELEAEIKEECLNSGESIKGQKFQVIYTKGREIFDTARLKAALPNTYRDYLTTSKPSARIAEIKGKE